MSVNTTYNSNDDPGLVEREYLIYGLIHDQKVIEAFKAECHIHHSKVFTSKEHGIIVKLALDYYKKHNKPAMDAGLISAFEVYDAENGNNCSIQFHQMIGDFTDGWSRQKLSTEEILAKGERYLQRVQLDLHEEQSRISRASGNGELIKGFGLGDPIRLLHEEDLPASAIKMRVTRWLWEGWIAHGQLTLMDGLPGDGKGTLIVDIAARLTNGWTMPSGGKANKPMDVAIISNEDSWEDTIKPRLVAAQADMDRVWPIRHKDEMPITFPRDLAKVRRIVEKHKVGFIGIDSIFSCITSTKNTDTDKDSDVRSYLNPFIAILRSGDCGALASRHFTKDKKDAIHRGMGSQAWTAVSRIQTTVGRTEEGGQLYIAQAKNNLAARAVSQAFDIQTYHVPVGGRSLQEIEVGRIDWKGDADVTANEISCPLGKRGRPEKVGEAGELILSTLEDRGGQMDSKELEELVCGRLDISLRSFISARKAAGVECKKQGYQGKWTCHLPKNAEGGHISD